MPSPYKNIPIESIQVPEVRITAVYDDELKKLLADSLNVLGQVQPIVLVHDGSVYWLVDGLHRLDEAKAKGEKTIPAMVYEGSFTDVMLKNLVLNRIHGKTKASEMVKVLAYLYKELGYDTDKVAAETGLSRDYVERILRISTASDAVQAALDAEVIGVGHAYEVSRIPGFAAQEEIIAKQQLWRWNIKDLKQQVDQVLVEIDNIKATPPPAPTKVELVYTCDGCKERTDPKHLRSIMVCPGCYGELWRLKREQRQAIEPSVDAADKTVGG